MKKRFVICIAIVFMTNYVALSQSGRNLSYSLFGGYGWVAKTNDFMRGINVDNRNINAVTNFSFELTKDVDGTKQWHHRFKGFHYGAGLFHGIFNYSKNIGNPWGLYGFLGFTPVEKKHFTLRTDIALGFSGIWDVFSSENYYNVAVSTPIECYVHGRINAIWNINEHLHAGLSGSFIHFSNGTIKRPNKGINILTPALNVTYNPERITKFSALDKDNFTSHRQHIISFYGAVKGLFVDYAQQTSITTGDTLRDTIRTQYGIFGIQYRSMMPVNSVHNIGLGIDVSWNNTIGRTKGVFYKNPPKNGKPVLDRWTMSVFFAYEYNIDKLSIIVEPIVYFHKPHETYFPWFAQRLGLRYQFYKGYFFQIGLRAYQFTKADYIEWTIGWRIKEKIL